MERLPHQQAWMWENATLTKCQRHTHTHPQTGLRPHDLSVTDLYNLYLFVTSCCIVMFALGFFGLFFFFNQIILKIEINWV